MIAIEFFSGTARMSKALEKEGFRTITVDKDYEADYNVDVLELDREAIIDMCGDEPDFIWFSPPCNAFSVASIRYHWDGGFRQYIPKSEMARQGIKIIEWCDKVISWFPNALWAWENPRGVMRKMSQMLRKKRYTITFCQYGDERMKPTDIWTNLETWTPRSICKNGDSCHVSAPRGAKTGTQGLKNAHIRAALPNDFCDEIASAAKQAITIQKKRNNIYQSTLIRE